MGNKEETCGLGEGTHNLACECRERYFSALNEENLRLKEDLTVLVKKIRDYGDPILSEQFLGKMKTVDG